jgi:FMN-dependent NADH-azoreductase
VRDFLRFIGISDVEFVYAEGLALGDAAKGESLANAQRRLAELVPAQRIAEAA